MSSRRRGAACLGIILCLSPLAGGGTSTASAEPTASAAIVDSQQGAASPVLSADDEQLGVRYGQASGCPTTVTAGPGGDAWVPLVQQGLAWLCPYFGALNATVEVSVGPQAQGGPWPWADTSPRGPGGSGTGTLFSCNIVIKNLAGVSDPSARMATITHELFHCYQARIMGIGPFLKALSTVLSNAPGAGWLIDGSAEWVGECSVGNCSTTGSNQGSFISGQWWDTYLGNPQTPLFKRSYDAIGFYAHMQETGISPFQRLPAMLTALAAGDSDADVFAAAQLDDKFLETWAGGYARESSWGPGVWDTTGPGVTGTKPPLASTEVSNGASSTDDVAAYSNYLGAYTLDADVVTISVGADGHGQLDTVDGTTLDGPALNGSFCTLPAGCPLPSPCSHSGPDLGQLAVGDAVLAVNGGTSGSRVTVAGMSVDAFCQLQPAPAPGPPPTGAKSSSCTVRKETVPEGGGPVVVSTEPCLYLVAVQGNALVDVAAHPPDVAVALFNMAIQNAGAVPTSCDQLSVGPPEPYYATFPQAPPGITGLDGLVGWVGCLYHPVPGDGYPGSGVLVAWFSSASQAEQAYTAVAAVLP